MIDIGGGNSGNQNNSSNNDKNYGSADTTYRGDAHHSQTNRPLPPVLHHKALQNYLTHPLPKDNDYTSDCETTGSRQDEDAEDDIYKTTLDRKDQTDIDYEALDSYIKQESDMINTPATTPNSFQPRQRRLSTMVDSRRFSLYGDRMKVIG